MKEELLNDLAELEALENTTILSQQSISDLQPVASSHVFQLPTAPSGNIFVSLLFALISGIFLIAITRLMLG